MYSAPLLGRLHSSGKFLASTIGYFALTWLYNKARRCSKRSNQQKGPCTIRTVGLWSSWFHPHRRVLNQRRWLPCSVQQKLGGTSYQVEKDFHLDDLFIRFHSGSSLFRYCSYFLVWSLTSITPGGYHFPILRRSHGMLILYFLWLCSPCSPHRVQPLVLSKPEMCSPSFPTFPQPKVPGQT